MNRLLNALGYCAVIERDIRFCRWVRPPPRWARAAGSGALRRTGPDDVGPAELAASHRGLVSRRNDGRSVMRRIRHGGRSRQAPKHATVEHAKIPEHALTVGRLDRRGARQAGRQGPRRSHRAGSATWPPLSGHRLHGPCLWAPMHRAGWRPLRQLTAGSDRYCACAVFLSRFSVEVRRSACVRWPRSLRACQAHWRNARRPRRPL
jgi:hypothetical protein